MIVFLYFFIFVLPLQWAKKLGWLFLAVGGRSSMREWHLTATLGDLRWHWVRELLCCQDHIDHIDRFDTCPAASSGQKKRVLIKGWGDDIPFRCVSHSTVQYMLGYINYCIYKWTYSILSYSMVCGCVFYCPLQAQVVMTFYCSLPLQDEGTAIVKDLLSGFGN